MSQLEDIKSLIELVTPPPDEWLERLEGRLAAAQNPGHSPADGTVSEECWGAASWILTSTRELRSALKYWKEMKQ